MDGCAAELHLAVSLNSIEEINIMGFALSREAERCVAAAFDGWIRYASTTDQLRGLFATCSENGPTVIFWCMESKPLQPLTDRRSFSAKVIGLHPSCGKAILEHAFEAGFDGVLECENSPEIYRRAASSVLSGELWFPRAYLSHKTRELRTGQPPLLSAREMEIFHLASLGRSNQIIADSLYISRDTVRWHLRSIHSKLGTSSRDDLSSVGKRKLSL